VFDGQERAGGRIAGADESDTGSREGSMRVVREGLPEALGVSQASA
jgi:hypothetical protein